MSCGRKNSLVRSPLISGVASRSCFGRRKRSSLRKGIPMNNATETTNVNQPQPTAQDDLGCAAEFFKTAKVQFAREGRQSRDLSAAISIVRNSVKEKMTNSPCAGKVSDSVENALSMAALLKFEE